MLHILVFTYYDADRLDLRRIGIALDNNPSRQPWLINRYMQALSLKTRGNG